jgi:hypothetical protein
MRENYFVVGEGILTTDGHQGRCERPSTEAELRKFRFSRLGPKGTPVDPALLQRVTSLGGSVVQPPLDTPHGRLSVVAGAHGETFSLMQLPAEAEEPTGG